MCSQPLQEWRELHGESGALCPSIYLKMRSLVLNEVCGGSQKSLRKPCMVSSYRTLRTATLAPVPLASMARSVS